MMSAEHVVQQIHGLKAKEGMDVRHLPNVQRLVEGRF